jgi:hypothetical protein
MRMCGKVVAARAGYVTTYMPKPSGIQRCMFHEPLEQENTQTPLRGRSQEWLPSDGETYRWTTRYGRKMAVLNSWPNSYKRLDQDKLQFTSVAN